MKRKQLRRANKWRDRVSKYRHFQRYKAIKLAAVSYAIHLDKMHKRVTGDGI